MTAAVGPAALVLAGGAARRMGGIDKLGLPLGPLSVLDRVLQAARPVADPVVVVGPRRPTVVHRVLFVSEPQPGGGPVPAVRAGLDHVRGVPVVVVMAGDLPLLESHDLRRLLAPLEDDPELRAVAAADHAGRPNPLLAAYLAPVLRAAAAGLLSGAPASRLLPTATAVVDLGERATLNVNQPHDLERAAALLER